MNRALLPSHGGSLEITLSVLLIHLRRQTAFWKYQKNVFVYTYNLGSTVNFTKFYPQLFISTSAILRKIIFIIRWKRKAKACYRSVGAKYELRRTFQRLQKRKGLQRRKGLRRRKGLYCKKWNLTFTLLLFTLIDPVI